MTNPNDVPAWKQRAAEKSIRTAKLSAEQRVQKFLDAAQDIIADKGTTEFTVQEVVDRSGQSLRSFYLQFDGKHSLLLALLEDELSRSADQMRVSVSGHTEPIDRLRAAILALFDTCRPNPTAPRPLLNDIAPQLIRTHPTEFKSAHAPLRLQLTEMLVSAAGAGALRADADPAKTAVMVMRTVMSIAQSGTGGIDTTEQTIGPDEVWEFCSRGFTGT